MSMCFFITVDIVRMLLNIRFCLSNHAYTHFLNRHSSFKARKTKKTVENEFEKIARKLSRTVVDEANDILVDQFRASKDLRGMEGTTSTHLQNRTRVFAFKTGRPNPTKCTHRRPIHRRTRVVTAYEVTENGETFVVITCGCGHFNRYLCACRHMYGLLDREPIGDQDVFPERCKSYELAYCEDENFRDQCNARNTLLEKHQGLILYNTKLEDITLNPG